MNSKKKVEEVLQLKDNSHYVFDSEAKIIDRTTEKSMQMSKITRAAQFCKLEDKGDIAGDSLVGRQSVLPEDYPVVEISEEKAKKFKMLPDLGVRGSQPVSPEALTPLAMNIDVTSEKGDEDPVDKQILNQIIYDTEHNIPLQQARNALIKTGNKSAKDAISYYYSTINKSYNFRNLMGWINEASQTNRFPMMKTHCDDRGRLDPTRHIADQPTTRDGKKQCVLQYMVQLTAEDPDTGKINTRKGLQQIPPKTSIKRAVPGPNKSTDVSGPETQKTIKEDDYVMGTRNGSVAASFGAYQKSIDGLDNMT